MERLQKKSKKVFDFEVVFVEMVVEMDHTHGDQTIDISIL